MAEPRPKRKIIIIPAKKESPQEQAKKRNLRVAAYCRVSTGDEEQLTSYENQKAFYTEKIMKNPDWTMVDIFADEGITGTSTCRRKQFLRMIRQCRQGKIDMILAKSVSRFARNTLDTISYPRELRSLGIAVIFEEQNINSIYPESEFLIALHAAFAQSESESISANVRWGKRQSIKDGKVTFQYWTQKHLKWLETLVFEHPLYKETLREYLILYYMLDEKVAVYDTRIEEMSHLEHYEENVQKLCCFRGVAAHTALSLLVEVGDFQRFRSAKHFAAYLGLVPGEHSSSDKQIRTSITKAGNTHLRRLLVEAAQSYNRGAIGKKSAALKARQGGNPAEVIAYADKANERMQRKYYRIAFKSRHNIAKTAIARELACFVWGMMTGNISNAA